MNFYKEMNSSHWKGIVTEVGIGLDFSAGFLKEPGASNTILGVNCPYNDPSRPFSMRAVSLENAIRLANLNYIQAREQYDCKDGEVTELFGLAITGAHYEDRDSHFWVCLTTASWSAHMHGSIPQKYNRSWAGTIVNERVRWFLEGCLLSRDTWANRINALSESHYIDVLYAPGVSDIERLMLLNAKNPLAYSNGRFTRVADVVRKHNGSVYPGSFNPPTKAHLAINGSLFEITQKHCYKGAIAVEDLLHRIRMLNMEHKDVLITHAPRYVDKYNLVSRYCNSVQFVLGADAWNAMIAAHQYPTENWLSQQMPNVDFIIRERPHQSFEENNVSKGLKRGFLLIDADNTVSSTAVRNHPVPYKHPGITESISHYIASRGLYATEN